MSSITDRLRGADGQVLPLFAGGLIAILLVAALVFDVGQSLFQRRAQQDAADAAALAGARWLVDDTTGCKAAPSTANCSKAVAAARAIAEHHGYAASQITVNVPPKAPSRFAGAKGHIQVTIASEHQSWFAGLAEIAKFDISAMATAANTKGYSFPYSFLALNPTCSTGGPSSIGGNGAITVGGAVQVNTAGCSQGDLTIGGGGSDPMSLSAAGGCGVSGTYEPNGSNVLPDCNGPAAGSAPVIEGTDPVPDPLSELGVDLSTLQTAPAIQINPPANLSVPNNWNCPGGSGAGTATSPKPCKISMYDNSTNPTAVVLSPGIYWGGISIARPGPNKTLNVYLLPGIYAFAGGGFAETGNGSGTFNLRTIVSSGDTSFGGGVLIYNTDAPEACPGNGCMQAIKVSGNNGPGALELAPYQYDPYKNLLLYQDRDASSQPNIEITGQGVFDVGGTVYAPEAAVSLSGNGSGTAAQIISNTFDVTGNGDLNVTYDADGVYKLTGTGLVE